MGRFDEKINLFMNMSEEDLEKVVADRGRGVRCPECGAIAHSIDTVVIYCSRCKLRYSLDPYWWNEDKFEGTEAPEVREG